jgi:hypothetical protein
MKHWAPPAAAWLLLALLLAACGEPSRLRGVYSGQSSGPAAASVLLRLMDDGKGQWEIDGESTPLRWEERDGALWLHLRSGGVILARPHAQDGALIVELPTVGRLRLSRGG